MATKKLRAKVELKRAELALAEAEEEEALEQESKRSLGSRSRSSRGTDRLSARILRDKSKDMRELQEESINRFRATSQASGNTTRDLSPVAEDRFEHSEDRRLHALHLSDLSESNAKPSSSIPAAAPLDSNSWHGDWMSSVGESNPYLTGQAMTSPDRDGRCVSGPVEYTQMNPRADMFASSKRAPASDSGGEFVIPRQEYMIDLSDPHQRAVPDSACR